jgi:tRNA(fMet)-specific endonuclease VapC
LKYLFDTNTIIYAYKNQGQIRTKWAGVPFEDVVLCSINLYELEFGLSKSTNPKPLKEHILGLANRHLILNFDTSAALLAGQAQGFLNSIGKPIGPYDLLIAGIALSNDLILVTRNFEEFRRVPNLRIENWFE